MPTHLTKPFDTSGTHLRFRVHKRTGPPWRPWTSTMLSEPAIEFLNVTCYAPPMAPTPKKSKPRTPQQRMASRRERLRAQGLRPVQHWVPDLRDPKVLAEIRREGAMLSKHPEDAAIDDWLDTIRDPEDWS